MLDVRETEAFSEWLSGLRDRRARDIIVARVLRLARGLFGDSKSVGDMVSEMRIDYGPGYRLYYTHMGETVVLMLGGGDKGSQPRDIEAAKVLAKEAHR